LTKNGHDRGQVVKGTSQLAIGQGVSQGSALVRQVILGMVLSLADYGIGAYFVITVGLLNVLSNLSVEKLLVQSEHGEDPRLQSMCQAVQALRGVITALVLVLLSWPISSMLNAPEAGWAFRCLGLVPFLKGLTHLDIIRKQRELQFRPYVLSDAGPQVLITLLAWPLCHWLRDYSAILWLLVAKQALTVVLSHRWPTARTAGVTRGSIATGSSPSVGRSWWRRS